MTRTIYAYSPEQLSTLLENLGQPAFRARQVYNWLYQQGAHRFSDMTNLPQSLRAQLANEAPLVFPQIEAKHVSTDGTRKYLLRLADGALVETVGIPARGNTQRLTVCFSTQVGCAMACRFCATGQEGFTRNLEPGEMVAQLIVVGQDFGRRISNVVAMGQGEPFLNYEHLLVALRIMNDEAALGIGARHITVSTCGVVPGIERFGHEGEQFVLAVSLHSAIQKTRDRLMPKMASTPLSTLKQALVAYQEVCGRRVSLEYLLIDGVNDRPEDLDALKVFCAGLSVHINLLPMNAVAGSTFAPSDTSHRQTWAQELAHAGIETSVRTSRGSDIQGACGQLKNAH